MPTSRDLWILLATVHLAAAVLDARYPGTHVLDRVLALDAAALGAAAGRRPGPPPPGR